MTPPSPTYPPDAIPDGAIFGDLTVLRRLPPAANNARARYQVRCACGKERALFGEKLLYEQHATCEHDAHERPLLRQGVVAFGEMQTIAAWLRDPRCVVSLKTLCDRLYQRWTLEDALTTPPTGK
jgi:hypothetical protein